MFGRRNGVDEQPRERPSGQASVAMLPGAARHPAEVPKTPAPGATAVNPSIGVNSSNGHASGAAARAAHGGASPRPALVKNATYSGPDRRGTAGPPTGQPGEGIQYQSIKKQLFEALLELIDVSKLTTMDAARARQEIGDVVSEIATVKKIAMSAAEQRVLLEDICNDILGYGPLEPLLARDDIADIMVNGSNKIFIEV